MCHLAKNIYKCIYNITCRFHEYTPTEIIQKQLIATHHNSSNCHQLGDLARKQPEASPISRGADQRIPRQPQNMCTLIHNIFVCV